MHTVCRPTKGGASDSSDAKEFRLNFQLAGLGRVLILKLIFNLEPSGTLCLLASNCEGGLGGFSKMDSALEYMAGIFKQSMRARTRVGIGLSYRPARLHRLAELIPWKRPDICVKDDSSDVV